MDSIHFSFCGELLNCWHGNREKVRHLLRHCMRSLDGQINCVLLDGTRMSANATVDGQMNYGVQDSGIAAGQSNPNRSGQVGLLVASRILIGVDKRTDLLTLDSIRYFNRSSTGVHDEHRSDH